MFGPHPVNRDIEISSPTMEKVQALIMLAVHEWIGEGRQEKAQVWVGLAARMASILGLGRTGSLATAAAVAAATPSSAVSLAEGEAGGMALVVDEPSVAEKINGGAMELDQEGPGGSGAASRKRRKLSSSGGPGPVLGLPGDTKEKEKKELVIQEEIARRTFWSVFMLDRELNRGSKRELAIRLEDINGLRTAEDEYDYPEEEEGGDAGRTIVRLPCNDAAFLFGQKVRTDVLRVGGYMASAATAAAAGEVASEAEQGEAGVVWQVGEKEGELSRIIRGLEIWGRVRRWRGLSTPNHYTYSSACTSSPPSPAVSVIVSATTTATTTAATAALVPPPPSSFYVLRDLIQTYSAPLPANLIFSPDNLNAHIHSKSSTSYAIIHVINFLSRMILHRHNMPFVPPSASATTTATALASHTLESAKEVFRCARGVLDLVKGLTDWNVGVETPLVGYAVYVAGVWAVYASAWPAMDDEKHLATGTEAEEGGPAGAHISTAIGQLRRFMSRWCLGGGDGQRWTDGLKRLSSFYRRVKSASAATAAAAAPPTASSSSSGSKSKPNGAINPPLADEWTRYEKMYLCLGRDELAGWIAPPPSGVSGGGLAPPRKSSGGGGADREGGGGKKRPSPQPGRHMQTHTAASSSSSTSDRWHAINKSPLIHPAPLPHGASVSSSTSSAVTATVGGGGGASTSAATTSTSHTQPVAVSSASASASATSATAAAGAAGSVGSPSALIEQFLIETTRVTSPKKRLAGEMLGDFLSSSSNGDPDVGVGVGVGGVNEPGGGHKASAQSWSSSSAGQQEIIDNGPEVKMEWFDEQKGV